MSELTKLEKIKALKDKIFLAFENFNNPEPIAAALPTEGYTGKLKTGEDVTAIPALENGASLSIVGSEGSLPAPDGSYELESGETFDVVGGVIANYTPVAQPPSQEEVEMKAEIETLKQANTALGTQIETLKAEFETKLSAIETKLSAQHNLTVALNDGLVELMEIPSVPPTQAPANVQLSTSAEDWRKTNQERFKQAKIKLK